MLEGLMQHDFPLTLQHVRDRVRTLYADSQIVSVRDGERSRASYGEVVERADRLAAALAGLGVGAGDRVATFMWNTREHFEVYLAVPCMGAVLHTLNVRLFAEQLTYIVNHAEDRVIVVDSSLVPVLEELAPTFESVRHYVVVGDGDTGSLPDALRYEELLAEQSADFDYPELDERRPPGSATRAAPPGTPRASCTPTARTLLHALGQCMADSIGLRADDRVMPVVPMFHANAWGLPYALRDHRRRPDHARART